MGRRTHFGLATVVRLDDLWSLGPYRQLEVACSGAVDPTRSHEPRVSVFVWLITFVLVRHGGSFPVPMSPSAESRQSHLRPAVGLCNCNGLLRQFMQLTRIGA